MRLTIATFLLTIPFSTLAGDYPGSLSGEQLWKFCEGENSDSDKCMAFIQGVRSGMAAQRMFIGYTLATQKNDDRAKLLLWLTKNEPFCSTEKISDQQVVDAFISNMKHVSKNNPSLLSAGAGVSVLVGAQQTYPCDSRKPKGSR